MSDIELEKLRVTVQVLETDNRLHLEDIKKKNVQIKDLMKQREELSDELNSAKDKIYYLEEELKKRK